MNHFSFLRYQCLPLSNSKGIVIHSFQIVSLNFMLMLITPLLLKYMILLFKIKLLWKEQHMYQYIHKYLFIAYIFVIHGPLCIDLEIWIEEEYWSAHLSCCWLKSITQLLPGSHFYPLYSSMFPKSSREISGTTPASCTAIIQYQEKQTKTCAGHLNRK